MADRYKSRYTGSEIDNAIGKARKLPLITEDDNEKTLKTNNEGNLVLSNLKTINDISLFGEGNFSFYSPEEINENFIKKYEEIPEASQNYLGEIIQYIGSSASYINGYFYQCVEGETAGTYVWNQIDVQPASESELYECTYDETTYNVITDILGSGKIPYVKNNNCIYYYSKNEGGYHIFSGSYLNSSYFVKVHTSDNIWSPGTFYSEDINNKTTSLDASSTDIQYPSAKAVYDTIAKYSTMPTASSSNEGKIAQYTGVTNLTYTNGYFYQCRESTENAGTYTWVQINVQPAPVITVDDHLDENSVNPVQNKVIDTALKRKVVVSDIPPSGTTPPIPVVQYITIDGETSKLAGGIANGIAYEQIEVIS